MNSTMTWQLCATTLFKPQITAITRLKSSSYLAINKKQETNRLQEPQVNMCTHCTLSRLQDTSAILDCRPSSLPIPESLKWHSALANTVRLDCDLLIAKIMHYYRNYLPTNILATANRYKAGAKSAPCITERASTTTKQSREKDLYP